MTLDEYLKRFIEGYLFEDLKSMAAIRLADGQPYGGAGYPMVMTAMAGIELRGALTAAVPSDLYAGKPRFTEFWQQYLCDNPRRDIATLCMS